VRPVAAFVGTGVARGLPMRLPCARARRAMFLLGGSTMELAETNAVARLPQVQIGCRCEHNGAGPGSNG
jgi:hypothetical protein